MIETIEGGLEGSGIRVAIIQSRFNAVIGDRLCHGALKTLGNLGVRDDDISVVLVPGAFEIPAAAQALADAGGYDSLIALGAVVRGETPHFDYVAGEASRGVRQVSIRTGVPVIFGVLTTDTMDQAMARSGGNAGDKGAEAAAAAVEMANLFRRIRG